MRADLCGVIYPHRIDVEMPAGRAMPAPHSREEHLLMVAGAKYTYFDQGSLSSDAYDFIEDARR